MSNAVPGIVVAVDGTSGSGKSSTSRGVAERLGLDYLDTGAMYRAMTWWMLRHGVDVHDAHADPAPDHPPGERAERAEQVAGRVRPCAQGEIAHRWLPTTATRSTTFAITSSRV